MIIGIDARFMTHPQRGGFKTYTENLIAALADVDNFNQYILYLDRPPDSQTKLPNRHNFTPCVLPGVFPLLGMPWREQVSLNYQAIRDHLDLLHSPCQTAPIFTKCKLVVTIHDMIWFNQNKYLHNKRRSLKRNLMQFYNYKISIYAAKRATLVLTVSQYSKSEISKYLCYPNDKIIVTSEAPSTAFMKIGDRAQIEKVRQLNGLPAEFILSIGSADPRKNIPGLLQAYALLPTAIRTQYHLVIAWTHDFLLESMNREIEKIGLNGQVTFLLGVSNEKLVLLYNAASLFVFPSLNEGFGLPLLEAMACGIPVVAANNSSIPEVAGDAAVLVQVEDPKTLSEKICMVLTDENLRAELIRKGERRVSNFSWEKCACETIIAYEKAIQI
jgi:glycosyltransferase involved in cell wall biosynthesis